MSDGTESDDRATLRGDKATGSRARRHSLRLVAAFVVASACAVLAACGPKPMIEGPVVLPEMASNQAVIEGSSVIHFGWREYTFLKAVDGRPAGMFACHTVKKGNFFSSWHGATYEWHCPTAAAIRPTIQTEETVMAATPGIGESLVISVTPGEHSFVVVRDVISDVPCGLGTCQSNPPGYLHQAELRLVAEPRHRYQVRTTEENGRYWTWIVDGASGAVVAGDAPPD